MLGGSPSGGEISLSILMGRYPTHSRLRTRNREGRRDDISRKTIQMKA